MIKIFTLLLIMLPVFGFGQLGTWNFFGASEVATWDATSLDANLVQTATMTRGADAAASAGANSFRTIGFGNDGIAVTNTDYFQFELEALTGFTMSLTSIDGHVRGTNTFVTGGGVENQFAYSLDGTTFTLIGSPLVVTNSNIALPTTDLSSIAALQNIAAGTTVTFRFYASGQTTTGGWGFVSASASTQSLIVGGTTTAAGSPCPTIPAPTVEGDTICSGSLTTLTASTTEPGATLTWFDSATSGIPLATGTTFTTPILTANTSYWVEATLPACPESARTEVVVHIAGSAPTISAGADQTVCAGDAVTLTASGAVSYLWNNGVTDGVPFTPTATQYYTVIGTDALGCYGVDTVEVIVNPLPTVTTTANQQVCAGTEITLAGSGATSYTWDNGITDNVAFTPTATTTYTVTGTDANGCIGTATAMVIVNPLPVITLTASGSTLTATSLIDASYKWFMCPSDSLIAGANTNTYVATANGSYKVEVTDTNGCVATSNCITVSTVGLEAKSNLNTFNISPNPTKGKVTITASGNETANVVIFNALGKEVSKVNNIQNGSVIDFSAFNNGVYMVQISTNKGTKVQRVVKN